MTQSRYIVTRSVRKHPYNVFHADLNENDDDLNWLNHDEFLCNYHMDSDTLDAVTNIIKGDPVFNKGKTRSKTNACQASTDDLHAFYWERRRK
jgi:hypothetical protein